MEHYPRKGTETVRDWPGYYIGWFANYCPGNPPYAFKPAHGWKVVNCTYGGTGTHGGCGNCAMVKIELVQKKISGPLGIWPWPILNYLYKKFPSDEEENTLLSRSNKLPY